MRIGDPFRKYSAVGVLLASGVLSGCSAQSTTADDDRVGDASVTETPSNAAASSGVNGTPGADVDAGSRTGPGADVDADLCAGPGAPTDVDVDAGSRTSIPMDDDEGALGSGGSASAGGDVDSGLDAGADAFASADAGANTESPGSDSGGSPESCEEGAVRCRSENGHRELCEAGAWVEQDFVCATSVRVNAGDGIPCAVKADGSFTCWWGRARYQLLDFPMPDVAGLVHSLEHVVYSPPGSAQAAILTREGTLVDPLGNQIEDVVQFEPSRHDVCWVTEDGSAACSEFGPITALPATQVAIDMIRRCALLRDGSVICREDNAAPVTLVGHYTDIDMGSYTVCGIELDGRVTCTDLLDETLTPFSPLEGTYTRLAVTDVGVCAMLESGQLECVSDVGDTHHPTGTYTDLDAGDWTVCAIRVDGSVECWQINDTPDETWFVPDGW